jgi:hypothetical protein
MEDTNSMGDREGGQGEDCRSAVRKDSIWKQDTIMLRYCR